MSDRSVVHGKRRRKDIPSTPASKRKRKAKSEKEREKEKREGRKKNARKNQCDHRKVVPN